MTLAATIRNNGLDNPGHIIVAADRANLPLPAACALMQKESGGRNVYGHDTGGMLAGFPDPPNADNFAAFWYEVKRGRQSNGVGPAQITSRDLLGAMLDRGLRPWVVEENMQFGFELLASYHRRWHGSWALAGKQYNGSPVYGIDLAIKVSEWRRRLAS